MQDFRWIQIESNLTDDAREIEDIKNRLDALENTDKPEQTHHTFNDIIYTWGGILAFWAIVALAIICTTIAVVATAHK